MVPRFELQCMFFHVVLNVFLIGNSFDFVCTGFQINMSLHIRFSLRTWMPNGGA